MAFVPFDSEYHSKSGKLIWKVEWKEQVGLELVGWSGGACHTTCPPKQIPAKVG